MGLMNRVLEKRTESHSVVAADGHDLTSPLTASMPGNYRAEPGVRGARELLDSCLEQIESISGGVTVPGSLFEFLVEILGIHKGALLVRDPEDDLFKVWAYRDLDPTSRSRLTMSRSDISELCRGTTVSFRADTADPVYPYLSFREARSLETAAVVKLRHRSRLAGLLLILDSDLVGLDAESRDMLLAAVSEPIARRLVDERERFLDEMYTPLLLDGTDFRRSVEDLAEGIDTEHYSIALMSIRLDEIESMLTNLIPGYASRRARGDAKGMICSLLGGAGDICVPEPTRIVASVLLHRQTPTELLVAELEERLRERMPVLPNALSLDIDLRSYPHNSLSLDSVLSTLVPQS